MNLNQYGQGEQTVYSALIAGGSAIFNTNRPTPADNDVCTNSLGEARGYFVDLLNASGGVGLNQICGGDSRAERQTYELQSLMCISYSDYCLRQKSTVLRH